MRPFFACTDEGAGGGAKPTCHGHEKVKNALNTDTVVDGVCDPLPGMSEERDDYDDMATVAADRFM